MPRLRTRTTDFSAGEWSPRLEGRVDLEKYPRSARTVENFLLLHSGAAQRRPGLRFVAPAKFPAQFARLIPFVYSRSQAYVLELGDGYGRVFTHTAALTSAGAPVEFATPYSGEAVLRGLKFIQSADTLYLTHEAFPPAVIERVTPTIFRYRVLEFQPGPTEEIGEQGAHPLTPAAVSGAAVTLTVPTPYWYTSDVGRGIEVIGGPSVGALAVILSLTSPTQVVAEILEPFASTAAIPVGLWRLTDSPQAILTPTVPVATRVGTGSITPSAVTGGSITITNSTPWLGTDVGQLIIVLTGASAGARAQLLAVNAGTPTVATAQVLAAFANTAAIAAAAWQFSEPINPNPPPVGAPITLLLDRDGWRASDVGRTVRIAGGEIEVTALVNVRTATGAVRSELAVLAAQGVGAWTLEDPAWSPALGYPTCCTFLGDRFWLARGIDVWGSRVGDYYNFASGTLDDDAITFALNTDQQNDIRWMVGLKKLMIGTIGGEFAAYGNQGPLTPTNIQVDPETAHGSAINVSPLRVGSVVLFANAAQRGVRQLVYAYDIDSFVADDLLLLADHITTPVRVGTEMDDRRILEMAYQKSPYSIVWTVRADGLLAALTYLREQNVFSWARHITGTPWLDNRGQQVPASTDGAVETVAVIPHPDADREQVWVIVRRTVDGTLRRYVETLDDTGVYYDALYTDSALTYDGVQRAATLTPGALDGADVLFTTDVDVFVPAHLGTELRMIDPATGTSMAPRAEIVTVVDARTVHAHILAALETLDPIPPKGWGIAVDTVAGLGHLEGRVVDIVGDGAVYPQQEVKLGAVSLTPAAVRVEVGLPYVSVLVASRPEYPAQGGATGQGVKKRHARLLVRLFESLGCTLAEQQIPFRRSSDAMGMAVPLFTGDKEVSHRGIDREGYFAVRQERPLPMTVLLLSTVMVQAE
jgi:hypothetical protein